MREATMGEATYRSKGHYRSFSAAIAVLFVFSMQVFLRTQSSRLFNLNTALKEGFQLDSVPDIKSETDMWNWILPVLKGPLPDVTSQAQSKGMNDPKTLFGRLHGLRLRKSLADATYVSQFNQFILPIKVVMRTGEMMSRDTADPLSETYHTELGYQMDYSKRGNSDPISDMSVVRVFWQSGPVNKILQLATYGTESAAGTEGYVADIMASCDGQDTINLPASVATAPPLGEYSNKFVIGIEGFRAQNAEEHNLELEVADRVIQLKDAQGDINTDPRALGTISQYWRACLKFCELELYCAKNKSLAEEWPFPQDKCIVECMDSQLHGQVPSVINCKYQKFQTDFTKVTCNEATLIAACAMPDPAFSGDYYFSDAIEMYQAKFSPTYTIQRNGRNITNPVTTAEAMFEPGWTHQNAYNVTVMKIMHSIFFTDAGDKPAYWDTLHVPPFNEVPTVWVSETNITEQLQDVTPFPLEWVLQAKQLNVVNDDDVPFREHGLGAIEATFCTGAKFSSWSISLENPVTPAVDYSFWKPYHSNRTAVLNRNFVAHLDDTIKDATGQNVPEGMVQFYPEMKSTLENRGTTVGIDGVYQSREKQTIGDSYAMGMSGRFELMHRTRVAGSGLRYACLDEVHGNTLFYNVIDGISSVPASKMPSCSEFPLYTEQKDSFTAAYIMWASQPQYADACEKLGEDESDLLEFLGEAITKDDLMQGYLKCASMMGVDDYVLHALAAFSYEDQGFVTMIDYLSNDFVSIIEYLKFAQFKDLPWYALSTKEVEYAFVTFNPYLDVISRTQVSLVLDNVGNIVGTTSVESFPQDFFECYGGPFGFVLFSALMLGVTASVVSEVREMCKEGFLVYVTNGSNIVDWLRISLFVAQFTMELLFSLKSSSLRDLFEVHTESSQAELEHSADAAFTATSSIRDALDIIVTINLLLHLAWIMKYFRHPKLAIVRNTISKSCMDLAHFMVVFLIVYAIFLVMANCLFGQDIKSYSSMGNTFITLFLILLGDFDYGEISQAFPLGAVLFFCSFILVMSFVMFNIILGIVCAAYDEASATNDGDDDESMFYEMLKIVKLKTGLETKNDDDDKAGGVVPALDDDFDDGSSETPESPTSSSKAPIVSTEIRAKKSTHTERTQDGPQMPSDLDEIIVAMFGRYDVDDSGTINTYSELEQLCLNLAFKLDLHDVTRKLDDVLADVKAKSGLEVQDWDIDTFSEWFKKLAYGEAFQV